MDRPSPMEQDPADGWSSRVVPPLVSLLILGVIAARTYLQPAAVKIVQADVVAPEAPPAPKPKPAPRKKEKAPEPPPAVVAEVKPPTLDKARIAKAEARLDDAARERAVTESRLADLKLALEKAQSEAETESALLFTLENRTKDAEERIERAIAEAGKYAGARDRLRTEIAAIEKNAKPKRKALLDKSPVARPVKGDEVHFEVRRNRVTPIELDRLVELVKADARIRMKVGTIRGRPINATVGPIGAFSLKYELGLLVADSGNDFLDVASVAYGLRGWELVPVSEERGETLEGVVRPGSDYANAIMKLHPGKSSITFWVYPDGFALYRRLRDDLHARGFLVAARPLPEGLSIQASPSGSASAGQ